MDIARTWCHSGAMLSECENCLKNHEVFIFKIMYGNLAYCYKRV